VVRRGRGVRPADGGCIAVGSAGDVGFDHQHRNELEDELIASLFGQCGLGEHVRELLARACRESGYDEYLHSVWEWFGTLARRHDAREPVPGTRTAIQGALELAAAAAGEVLASGRT
jgi:hypothetical protein